MKHIWRRLTEPSATIQEPVRRRNARLIASLLVIFTPLGFVIAALPALLDPSESVWQDNDFISMVAGAIFWGSAYTLSRSGRYELAAKLAVWTSSIVTYTTIAESNPWETVFLIVPVLLSSLMLSVRATVLLGIVDLVAVLLLPVFHETVTLTDVITGPLSFMLIGTTVVLWGAHHRDRLERDRQAELAQSEARHRDLFETTFEGIAIYASGVLVDANPGLAQMFGYSPSDIIGMSLLDLVAEESRDLIAQNVEGERPQPCEAWGVRKDGTAFRMELLAKAQTWHDRAAHVIAIRDMTERVRTEEALRRSVVELENLQQITEALLSLEELSQVIHTVAEGIVTQLGFDTVLVSRYVEEENVFTGMDFYPMPAQFDGLLRLIGRPDLKDAPAKFKVPYQRGENPRVDRVLDGEIVTSDSMADFYHPWIPRPAAATVQKLLGMQAYIDLPLRVKGKTVGTIVAGVREAPITADRQKALARVADQAAVAFENARLYEAEHQRSAELGRSNAFITALGQVAARIETTHDPNQVMAALGSELERLGLDCFIILQEPDTQEFLVRYISIEPSLLERAEKLAGIRMDNYRVWREMGPFKEAIEHKRPVFVPDLASLTDFAWSGVARPVFQRILPLMGINPDTPFIYLPLMTEERAVGVLTVWGAELREADLPALSVFTNQVAVALENARLYEQAQQEIAERVRAEAQIKASLREKEVLLQEIHHRVKNNMQVISSLLNLQSGYVEDPQALEVFQESQHRVRSMALVHEKLYQSENLAQIDFGEYIRSLVTSLSRSYSARAGDITLDIQADNVPLSIDTAVPCGLILNELVSNALKHAFPNGQAGEIRVELGVEDGQQVSLTVGDNGVGFPHDLDWRSTTSLGLQLVHTLVGQLEGSVEMHSNRGTEFKIQFGVTH